ncbi:MULTISPECIES: transglutaminase [unclassified Leeuwenhoekiella]|uniref:transglutaminase n=1 Tax=unclassified Leeuwenhoekiella TaxID=2615029 RepID=UPI0025BEC14B|nr:MULTISPECIES: transglutaminase [unclassified Leeuwenhoekiella]
MNWYRFYTALLCLGVLFSVEAYSQKSPLDKVSEEQLKMTIYEKDTSAAAVYLNKHRETYFDYTDRDGFIIINEFTERIKILDKAGLDYATKKISSYKRDESKEFVTKVWGNTYNLENGKIDVEKLDESAIFEREVSEHFDETAFTMPNAKVGSVVEWGYKTVSPFYKVDDLVFQEDIPVMAYHATIRTPGAFTFRRIRRGYFEVQPEEKIEKRTLGVNYNMQGGYGTSTQNSRSARLSFSELVAVYEKENVPALKDEIFVTNPRSYRMSVIYELISTEFNRGNKKEYATTWDEVARTIFKDSRFGDRLERTRFLKGIKESIFAKKLSDHEKIEFILDHVKTRMTWDGEYGKYAEDELDEAYERGSGSVAEINLILIALLKECGFEVYPVLLSSKQYGIPLYPTLEGYNYVIAGVRNKGKIILLDATDKMSSPNILPNRVYNWTGRMVSFQGVSQEIDLFENIAPASTAFLKVSLTEEGILEGEYKERLSSLEALNLRHRYFAYDKSEWEDEEIERFGISEMLDYNLEGVEDLNIPIVRSFNFKVERGVDRVGNKIFVSPLGFLRLSENPFKSDTRQFPISFDYPFSKDITINMELPQGYKVSSLPESTNLGLPDDSGTFFYSIAENNGILQVMMRFKLKKHIIPVEYYESLKEFFKLRVDKENEKVVLEKV